MGWVGDRLEHPKLSYAECDVECRTLGADVGDPPRKLMDMIVLLEALNYVPGGRGRATEMPSKFMLSWVTHS
jgi:hypothetical protein